MKRIDRGRTWLSRGTHSSNRALECRVPNPLGGEIARRTLETRVVIAGRRARRFARSYSRGALASPCRSFPSASGAPGRNGAWRYIGEILWIDSPKGVPRLVGPQGHPKPTTTLACPEGASLEMGWAPCTGIAAAAAGPGYMAAARGPRSASGKLVYILSKLNTPTHIHSHTS